MSSTNHPSTAVLSSVNFNNIDEVTDYAVRLMDKGNSLGVLSGDKPLQSKEAVDIYQAAKGWVNSVKKHIPILPPSQSLRLVDIYEIMHRIAFWKSPNAEETTGIKLTAFNAMIHGDKDIDEYIMFRVIRNAVRQRNKAFFDKPLTWSCMVLEQWHKEATEGFDRTKLSDYDITSRVQILLESDLYAYEGHNQEQFKQRLSKQHCLSLCN